MLLWDIDQTWSFDANLLAYAGVADDEVADRNGYLDGFKNILFNERVNDTNFEFNYFADGWEPSSEKIRNLTKWGASDGTSRTNAHAISCWVRHTFPLPFPSIR